MVDVAGGCTLLVRATPGARKTEVAGMHDGALRIRLQAPAVEGRANEALVEFLADALGLRRRDVSIESGQNGRVKRLRIAGRTAREAAACLSQTRA